MNLKLTTPAAVAAALAGMLATAPALAADYAQAPGPGSILVFASKYDGEVFTGSFPGFATKLSFDPANPAAGSLDVVIPLAGARSGNSDRDSTLQSADFFNVGKFATARYTAKGFRAIGNDQFAADGTLELRGVSKPVTLTFTWKPGTQPVLTGKATVKRLDFSVGAGDWADTKTIPDETAISTIVKFDAK
ncbi:YceI family protein [Stenotrophomonas sp. GD04145]|uniref:YceI family protein n=1 Tax=Stenotrophomonas sp. GD04145 TaxID=2975436 RepID=UPI00244A8ECD|nr:YceI family protein [Stenotrophomonas sp. GD04145]MDH0172616.1 YceI family protein [Stenotrophomonas sp. GD04145]